MLNFRNTVIFFAVILLLVIAADIILPVSKWVYAGIILVFLGILAWGSRYISSDFYVKSVCYGNRDFNRVVLTFDDGPDAQVTPMILDILKEHQVKAAFFVIGSKAEANPDILKRIDKEGHVIGCHSYSHHYLFDFFSSARMKAEMRKTNDVVYSVIEKKPKLFRPPYGVTNPPLSKAIDAMQYQSVGWSLRSKDTVIKDEANLMKSITSRLRPGDIILFHDNKPWNVSVLDKFIKHLKEKEFEVTRVDELININAYDY